MFSSEVVTDVEKEIPSHQTASGPHKKVLQGRQGGDLPEGHRSMLLSLYEIFIIKCDPSDEKSTNTLF